MRTLRGTIRGDDETLHLHTESSVYSLEGGALETMSQTDVLMIRVGDMYLYRQDITMRAVVSGETIVDIGSALVSSDAWVAVVGHSWQQLWSAQDLAPRTEICQVHACGNDVEITNQGGTTMNVTGELPEWLPYFFPTHQSPMRGQLGFTDADHGQPDWILLWLSAQAGLFIPDPDRFTKSSLATIECWLGWR